MTDRIIVINKQEVKLIPLGFCACGCGQKTRISTCNVTRLKWVKGQPIRFINGHNGRLDYCRYIGKGGYIYVKQSEHPNANSDGYIFEHIVIIEKAMGKVLPNKSQSHHVDHNPSNNSNDNLVACEDDAYHKLLHRRERALKECGHAHWRKCSYCKQWDSPDNLVIRPYPQSGVHHLQCSRDYAKYMYSKNKLRTYSRY